MKYENYNAIRTFEKLNNVKPYYIILSEGKALFGYGLKNQYIAFYVQDDSIDFTAYFENKDLLGAWKEGLNPEWEGELYFFDKNEEVVTSIEGNEDFSEEEINAYNSIIEGFNNFDSPIHFKKINGNSEYFIIDNYLKTFDKLGTCSSSYLIEEPISVNVCFRTFMDLTNITASCDESRIYLHSDECDMVASCNELSISKILELTQDNHEDN